MKKGIGFAAILAIIVLLVFVYLRIGSKATHEAVSGMKESQAQIDDAKRAVDALNASSDEAKKAIENATGTGGK
jgi:hypothetical protein